MFALFKEVRRPERRKKRKLNNTGGAVDVESDESDDSEDEVERVARMPGPGPVVKEKSVAPEPEVIVPPPADVVAAPEPGGNELIPARYASEPFVFFARFNEDFHRLALFRQRLSQVWTANPNGAFFGRDDIPLKDLLPVLNEGLPTTALFGTSEAILCADAMTEANEIMHTEGTLYSL